MVCIVACVSGDGSTSTTPAMGCRLKDVATQVALRVVSNSQADIV
jgi:hypothetical protein